MVSLVRLPRAKAFICVVLPMVVMPRLLMSL